MLVKAGEGGYWCLEFSELAIIDLDYGFLFIMHWAIDWTSG